MKTPDTMIQKNAAIVFVAAMLGAAVLRTIVESRMILFAVPVFFIVLLLTGKDYWVLMIREGAKMKFVWGYALWCMVTSFWSAWGRETLLRSGYQGLELAGLLLALLMLGKEKEKIIFNLLLVINAVIVVLQVVSLSAGVPADRWSGGNGLGFMGFISHQNTAGALLLFSLPGVSYKLLNLLRQESELEGHARLKKTLPMLILFLSNIFLIILSSSRAVEVSLILMLFIRSLFYGRIGKLMTAWGGALVLIAVLYATVPAFRGEVRFLIYKKSDSPTATRMPMYEYSLDAAKHGGLFGLGFGVSDTTVPKVFGHFEGNTFIREKGNSTLALLEATGVIGLVLFLLVYFQTFAILLKQFKEKKKKTEYRVVGTFLLATFIHAQFEGWWGGVTSFFFLVFISMIMMTLTEQKVTN